MKSKNAAETARVVRLRGPKKDHKIQVRLAIEHMEGMVVAASELGLTLSSWLVMLGLREARAARDRRYGQVGK